MKIDVTRLHVFLTRPPRQILTTVVDRFALKKYVFTAFDFILNHSLFVSFRVKCCSGVISVRVRIPDWS